MNHRIDHIAVLIPARNEEALLPECIQSVMDASNALPAPLAAHIVIVVDSSTDKTYEIAKDLVKANGQVLTTHSASAGAARALAARAALARYAGNPAHFWLANTDADCRVPRDWLVQQLTLAQMGAEAVAGIVHVEDFSEHRPGTEQFFRETYLIRPDGTHPHVHGANIGIRADTYVRAGGWSELATGEDHDLWRRISDSKGVKLSDAKLRVLTSGRRIGRAPSGFAEALSAWDRAVA
jgi:glycosyltransferase involved in cell wall biosynthesis